MTEEQRTHPDSRAQFRLHLWWYEGVLVSMERCIQSNICSHPCNVFFGKGHFSKTTASITTLWLHSWKGCTLNWPACSPDNITVPQVHQPASVPQCFQTVVKSRGELRAYFKHLICFLFFFLLWMKYRFMRCISHCLALFSYTYTTVDV